MKAVILAAGPGKRMMPLTEETPKSLLKIREETIIGRQIRILKESGISEEDIIIVVGYESKEFEKKYKKSDIIIVKNDIYKSTDNLYSFKMTRKYVEGDNFLVVNADAIFSKKIISKSVGYKGSAYPIDTKVRDDESIKVSVKDGKLKRILGKEAKEYDGVTTEIFKIGQSHSGKLFDVAEMISKSDKKQWFDSAVDKILDDVEFGVIDVSDCYWREVDTPEELKKVRKEMENKKI